MVGFSVGFAVEARNRVGLAGVGLGLRLILLGLLWLGFRWWWFFDPCRSGGHPRPSLLPGVAVPDPFWLVTGMSLVGHQNSILQRKGHHLCWPVPAVCVLGLVAEILICLFGCCEKLIWVGVDYFLWK